MNSENNPSDFKKLSLRRASISDTNLPKFDFPQLNNKEKSPFGRYLSGLIEGSSNTSLNKLESTDSIDQKNIHWIHQQNTLSPPGTNLNTTSQATPVLRKSATTGFALGAEHQSPNFNQESSIVGDSGLTMNFSSRPSTMTSVPSSTVAAVQDAKKSTFFGGLSSLFSFDLLNKPLDDLRDREANYRLIMSLER